MLLLGQDQVTLYEAPVSTTDGHGWELAATSQAWSGNGSLQRMPGRSDSLAREGGGAGPFDPNFNDLAILYLPPDAPVTEGMIAQIGTEKWSLSQVRLVTDPTGTGDLDCITATAVHDGVFELDG